MREIENPVGFRYIDGFIRTAMYTITVGADGKQKSALTQPTLIDARKTIFEWKK